MTVILREVRGEGGVAHPRAHLYFVTVNHAYIVEKKGEKAYKVSCPSGCNTRRFSKVKQRAVRGVLGWATLGTGCGEVV